MVLSFYRFEYNIYYSMDTYNNLNKVEYDDSNLEHIQSGPDYGQFDSNLAWNLENCKEYEYQSVISCSKFTIEPIVLIDLI